MDFSNPIQPQNQFIFKNEKRNVELWLKREDLIHPEISGNKFRKLKYNLKEAEKLGFKTLLTFGGAFSNHISATAAAGNMFGFKTIGVIRGEELAADLNSTFEKNPTLKYAKSCGMEFEFISREAYRQKESDGFISSIRKKYGDFYLLPEGGTNKLAIKGSEEILTEEDEKFNFVCCPVGTGGTISGIINASFSNQKIIGFPALKGDFLTSEIEKLTTKRNWELVHDYHFGGYAKINSELVEFMNFFKQKNNIQLDPVYTAKMIFGIYDMIERGEFSKNTCILAIHTGGLQGISGMNNFLKSKKMGLIV
ncbi:MAG TPA: pyridoxal-phosphate dependent enzyme [Salinimicrobium sp.]|nr:pyridoxal-phosphate dependent enzyme [Salinimicrobium sp.]